MRNSAQVDTVDTVLRGRAYHVQKTQLQPVNRVFCVCFAYALFLAKTVSTVSTFLAQRTRTR